MANCPRVFVSPLVTHTHTTQHTTPYGIDTLAKSSKPNNNQTESWTLHDEDRRWTLDFCVGQSILSCSGWKKKKDGEMAVRVYFCPGGSKVGPVVFTVNFWPTRFELWYVCNVVCVCQFSLLVVSSFVCLTSFLLFHTHTHTRRRRPHVHIHTHTLRECLSLTVWRRTWGGGGRPPPPPPPSLAR